MSDEILDLHPDQLSLRELRNNNNANYEKVNSNFTNHKNRIDNIVASAGESNTEIVDARYDSVNGVTHPTIKDRLDNTASELAEKASKKKTDPWVDVVSDFGADPTGVLDSTTDIQNAINHALSNGKRLYFPKGEYLVGSNVTTYNYFVGVFTTIVNVDGFIIEGSNATIVDGRNMTTLAEKFCPVFLFDTCKNITIKGLDYKCNDMNYTLTTEMGYRGASYVMFLKDTKNVTLDYYVYNARYGVRFGDYNNPQYQGANGIINLDVKIRGDYVGYPVSVEMGRHLKLDITVNEFHRVAYLCGVQDVKIHAEAKNQYIANAYVLLSDTSYLVNSVTNYRACSHVEANVRDIGSTYATTDSNLFGFQLYSSFPTPRTNQIEKFSNIKLVGTVSKETTADVRALRTNLNGTIADVLEDIEVEFNIYNPKAINYFRITTDDTKTVRNFTIKNSSVDGAGYSTFQLGNKTEVTVKNSKLYQLTFNNLVGGKVFIQDTNLYQIKPNDPSYQCSTLYLDNVTYTEIRDSASFPAIYNTHKFSPKVGTTAQRPTTGYYIGMPFYDTTINKPIWYKGFGDWIDANGTVV